MKPAVKRAIFIVVAGMVAVLLATRDRWQEPLLGALGLVAVGAASYAVAGPPDSAADPPNTRTFSARLNGFQEVPAVSTTGCGGSATTARNGRAGSPSAGS